MNYWERESNWLYSQHGNRKTQHFGHPADAPFLIFNAADLPLDTTYSQHGLNDSWRIDAVTLSMMDVRTPAKGGQV